MTLIILAILLTTLLYIALVRGWIVNVYLLLAAIIDAFKDIACQFWISLSKIWKGDKALDLDEHESKIS